MRPKEQSRTLQFGEARQHHVSAYCKSSEYVHSRMDEIESEAIPLLQQPGNSVGVQRILDIVRQVRLGESCLDGEKWMKMPIPDNRAAFEGCKTVIMQQALLRFWEAQASNTLLNRKLLPALIVSTESCLQLKNTSPLILDAIAGSKCASAISIAFLDSQNRCQWSAMYLNGCFSIGMCLQGQ